MSPGTILGVAIVLPLLGALAILALGKWPNARDAAGIVTAGVLFTLVLRLVQPIRAGLRPEHPILEVLPGVSLSLKLEPLGLLFALVASFLWIVTALYAVGYMRGHHEKNQTRFFAFFAIAISAAMGVAFAGNLFTLFAFYEAITLCTFPLVTHHGTPEAKKAGRVYLGILLTTSIGFQLLAIIWTWNLAGTLDFQEGGILAGTASNGLLSVLLILFFFGAGKAAVMPFHRWLPAAMVAPTPVSALLHAVAVVKVGVFTILKVSVYVFGWICWACSPARRGWPGSRRPPSYWARSWPSQRTTSRHAWRIRRSASSRTSSSGPPGERVGYHRGWHAHCHARLREDHALFRRRRGAGGCAREGHQPDGWPRTYDADHLRRLLCGLPQHHRVTACGGSVEQVVPRDGHASKRARWGFWSSSWSARS